MKDYVRAFKLYLGALVLLAGALWATGCATMGAPPLQAPCGAWVAAEAAWGATEAVVRHQLGTQRALACAVPAGPAPQPAAPPVCEWPAEVPPLTQRAPPEQQPLPGPPPRE